MIDVCLVAPLNDSDLQQWEFVLSHWSINDIFIIGDMQTALPTASINPLSRAQVFEDITYIPKTCAWVLLAPQNGVYYKGNESLYNFVHPNNAMYIIGSDHRHLSSDEMVDKIPDHTIFIPTQTQDQMYSWVAAGVTFYDRYLKEHNNG